MNLNDLKINGVDELHVTDSLNASLLGLKISVDSNTVIPNSNELCVYVDQDSKLNPTNDRKTYLFDLEDTLKCVGTTSDEFVLELSIENNDAFIKTFVERKIGVDPNTGNYVLPESVIEEIESYPLTLFEGENYIYTNYENAIIELIYPKNTEFNKMFLNNATYYNHRLKNDGEFGLEDIYFKDAFTKTQNNLNIEVNNASIDSLESRNNNFSLDCQGNLIVKSINAEQMNIQNILDMIYPVDSIYISLNNTNPSTLFGGVWEQIKDKFLLCAGDTYNAGSTGGEATHTLTINEMPKHHHDMYDSIYGGFVNSVGVRQDGGGSNHKVPNYAQTNAYSVYRPGDTGGNQAHNNMPPYLAVYAWKRVS